MIVNGKGFTLSRVRADAITTDDYLINYDIITRVRAVIAIQPDHVVFDVIDRNDIVKHVKMGNSSYIAIYRPTPDKENNQKEQL